MPCYQLTEQLRIDPGLWDLPGEICYENKIKTWDKKTVSAQGAALEDFLQTLPGESPGSFIQPAAEGQTWPVLLDVSDGFTFKQVNGTLRGNTFTIYYGMTLILHMVETAKLKPANTVVIYLYLYQYAL
jgi:hypothetical protein